MKRLGWKEMAREGDRSVFDLLSNLRIFLTSRWPENGQERGKREEVDIPPEPRAHAQPS